jgi:hypothetical protein
MVSKNAEAGRGRHPVPAPNSVWADSPQYRLARPAKQANFVANCFGRTPLKIGTRALQSWAARSKIVRFDRLFRPRIEVEHRQCSSPTKDWFFTLEYVGERGPHFLGKFEDVAVAFNVARAFRNRGVRIVCVDWVRP